MGALSLSDLTISEAEPRLRDQRLGEALGFSRRSSVRVLIRRSEGELLRYGVLRQSDQKTGKRGRPERTYWLNEGQALLVCMFADTPKAADVREQVIKVFLAWRHGQLTPAAQADALAVAPEPSMAEVLRQLADVRRALGLLGRQLMGGDTYAEGLALTHADIWAGGRRPRWWHDGEVRGAALSSHRQCTVEQARAALVDRFGPGRAPSRSALHRFWQRLDQLKRQDLH